MFLLIVGLILVAGFTGYKQVLYPAFAIVLVALALELVGAWRERRRDRARKRWREP